MPQVHTTEQLSEQSFTIHTLVFCRSGLSKQNIGDAHMVGWSEGGVVAAQQLLALVRPSQHTPPRHLLCSAPTQKLHHQPLESSLPSTRKEWKRQLRFDELVWEGFQQRGYEEASGGQVGGGWVCLLAWLVGDGGRSKLVSLTAARSICSQHLAACSS